MPYYGDPETLRQLNRNVASLSDAELSFDEQIELYNQVVEPLLVADLYSVFTSWPDPDSTNQNLISTLWLCAMTAEIQASKYATNVTGQPSAYGDRSEKRYEYLLNRIKSGRALVPGAVRHSAGPTQSAFARRRWTISESNQPDEPQGVGDVMPHGLRN